MKAVLFLIRSAYKQILVGSIASLIAALLYLGGLRMLNLIIEDGAEWINFFLMVLFVSLSAAISIWVGKYITRFFEFKISQLRKQLSEHILKSNYQKAEDNQEKIVPVLMNDIITIGEFAKGVPELIVAIFQVIVIWVYMMIISWELTLGLIAIFLLTTFSMSLVQPRLMREEREVVNARNLLHFRLSGLAHGIKELFLNSDHKKSFAERTIAPVSDKQAKHTYQLNAIHLTIRKVNQTFTLVSFGLFVLLISIFIGLEDTLFLKFIALIFFIMPSLNRVVGFIQTFKRADIALEEIESFDVYFTNLDTENPEAESELTKKDDQPLIQLEDIGYTYRIGDREEFSVGPFDLDVFENEVLFITGGNGSGKTTLVKLLVGLYESNNGSIKYTGQLISNNNISNYQDLFSIAFSASYVFQDLGYIPHPDLKEKAKKYLQYLEIEDKVTIGDEIHLSSTDLSFGQVGRLCLFRALLEDKDIYVFDEWAANQDPHFKKKFYEEIIPNLKNRGKTIILVSHDDKYFHTADRIVKLRNGLLDEAPVLS